MKNRLVIISLLLVSVVIIGLLVTKTFLSHEGTPQDKEEAIRQAQNYQTDDMCTMALVDAVHKETGAKYTFSGGCLAPGWEPEQ